MGETNTSMAALATAIAVTDAQLAPLTESEAARWDARFSDMAGVASAIEAAEATDRTLFIELKDRFKGDFRRYLTNPKTFEIDVAHKPVYFWLRDHIVMPRQCDDWIAILDFMTGDAASNDKHMAVASFNHKMKPVQRNKRQWASWVSDTMKRFKGDMDAANGVAKVKKDPVSWQQKELNMIKARIKAIEGWKDEKANPETKTAKIKALRAYADCIPTAGRK
jgi:hypothetical protein